MKLSIDIIPMITKDVACKKSGLKLIVKMNTIIIDDHNTKAINTFHTISPVFSQAKQKLLET